MNELIILTAKYVFLISVSVYVIYGIILWKKNKKKLKQYLFLSVISFPLTLVIAKLSGLVIHDPRPFVVEHVKPLIAHAADNGFPSDHTLLTMAIASIVFVYNKKLGIVLFTIASLIGTARVLAQIHHPLDIIGATVIAIGTTTIVFFIEKRYFHKVLKGKE